MCKVRYVLFKEQLTYLSHKCNYKIDPDVHLLV